MLLVSFLYCYSLEAHATAVNTAHTPTAANVTLAVYSLCAGAFALLSASMYNLLQQQPITPSYRDSNNQSRIYTQQFPQQVDLICEKICCCFGTQLTNPTNSPSCLKQQHQHHTCWS